jgi:hypothetical protein
MERNLTCQAALQSSIVQTEWKGWIKAQTYRDQGELIGKTVMDDAHWKKTQKLVDASWLIVKLLKSVDGKTPCMGKVYYRCFQTEQGLKNSSLSKCYQSLGSAR